MIWAWCLKPDLDLTSFILYLGDCCHVIVVSGLWWIPMLVSGVSHLTSSQAGLYLTSQPV